MCQNDIFYKRLDGDALRDIIKYKRCYVHNIFTIFSQQITGN